MQKRTKIIGLLMGIMVIFLSSGCIKKQPVQKESLKAVEIQQKEEEQERKEPDQAPKQEQKTEKKSEEKVFVHVCGAVTEPGVYEVERGRRVRDAIRLAGGFTQEADQDYLNQAKEIRDGEKIYVPNREETADGSGGLRRREEGSDLVADGSEGVNINRASKEELMKLDGIGEAKAEAILTYRQEQGAFESIEKIKEVSGIGEGVFQKIKGKITVD